MKHARPLGLMSRSKLSPVPTLEVRPRLDRRGRRIGRNWWREYNCMLLLDATLTWERDCESVALGYRTETLEYEALHPRPNLKAFLLANKGMNTEPEPDAAAA